MAEGVVVSVEALKRVWDRESTDVQGVKDGSNASLARKSANLLISHPELLAAVSMPLASVFSGVGNVAYAALNGDAVTAARQIEFMEEFFGAEGTPIDDLPERFLNDVVFFLGRLCGVVEARIGALEALATDPEWGEEATSRLVGYRAALDESRTVCSAASARVDRLKTAREEWLAQEREAADAALATLAHQVADILEKVGPLRKAKEAGLITNEQFESRKAAIDAEVADVRYKALCRSYGCQRPVVAGIEFCADHKCHVAGCGNPVSDVCTDPISAGLQKGMASLLGGGVNEMGKRNVKLGKMYCNDHLLGAATPVQEPEAGGGGSRWLLVLIVLAIVVYIVW